MALRAMTHQPSSRRFKYTAESRPPIGLLDHLADGFITPVNALQEHSVNGVR